MMAQTGIALEKVESMRWWLDKYCRNAGAIPKADALRQYHFQKLFFNERCFLEEKMKKITFSLAIDGTTDSLSRHILNTIIYPSTKDKSFLADVSFVQNENNQTIAHTLNSVVSKYAKSWQQIDAIVTDNASKNIKAINNIKSTFNNKLIHIRCVSHILQLICEKIYNHTFFESLHKLIANFQHLMNRLIEKKMKYKEIIKENGLKIILMPESVLT